MPLEDIDGNLLDIDGNIIDIKSKLIFPRTGETQIHDMNDEIIKLFLEKG